MDIHNNSEEMVIIYHFVWAPMRSKPCLVGDVAARLQALVEEKAELMAFEPVMLVVLPDRVYLAAAAPPTLAPHRIVCQVKAATSHALRDEFPELMRIPTLWTRAYLVLAGEQLTAEEVLQRYDAAQRPRRPRGRPRRLTLPLTDEAADGAL